MSDVKAILEIDLPDCCANCPIMREDKVECRRLCIDELLDYQDVCNDGFNPDKERASFCPLKLYSYA